MNQYVLVSGDFTLWGGMDRANYALAWHLAEAGSSVHLVGHFVARPLAEHPNVIWHRVPRPFNRHALAQPLLAFQGRRVAKTLAALGARVVVNGGNCAWPDVNWVHMVYAEWNVRGEHAPFFFRLRADWHNRRARIAEKRSLRLSQVVVANSKRTRMDVIEKAGLPEKNVHAVYYGIDPDDFHPAAPSERVAARKSLGLPEEPPIVAFVGALGYDRRKGFDALFNAWEALCKDSGWDALLVAAGGGAEVEYWKKRSAAAGLADRIRFLGFMKEVPRLLAASDALVSPTYYEAYGLGVHEALCCGLPAFVTRSAGVAERYPSDLHDLLLADPPDARDVAERLKRWHRARADFDARVAPLGALLRRRTWTDMSREIMELMEQPAPRPKH